MRISFERDASGSGVDVFNVHVQAPNIACDHAVVTWEGDGLDAFMSELARDWRGWGGTRRWEALEHGMSIEAIHRGRVVELLFIIRRDYRPDAWELRLPISITPGESLTRVTSACAGLFANAKER